MLGLSPLVLLLGGIGLVSILGGGAAWVHSVGKDAQRVEDAPIIEKWKGRAENAETANANVRHDVTKIEGEVASCKQTVLELQKPSAQADNDLAAAKIRSEQRVRILTAQLADLQRRANVVANSPPAVKCEAAQQLAGDIVDKLRAVFGFDDSPKSAPTSGDQLRISK